MTWIKICGTTNLEDALASVEAGANALGFVFAPSPRRISPRDAAKITAALPPSIGKVGVFVNQSLELVLDTVEKAGLTGVQLHGKEDARFARRLQDRCKSKLRLFKAVSMRDAGEGKGEALTLAAAEDAPRIFSALLLDSGGNGRRGGTGATFDWRQAAPMVRLLATRFPLVIAGGLNPDNVSQALQSFQPWGVDVVSGVERAPGCKDPQKLRAFVAAVRAFEAASSPSVKNGATRK